jgi:hypothetical protein
MKQDRSNPRAFDPKGAIRIFHRNLPHWQRQGVLYFASFRLHDSLPAEKLYLWRLERKQWLDQNPLPHTAAQHLEDKRLWDHRIHQWLDGGMAAAVLLNRPPGETKKDSYRGWARITDESMPISWSYRRSSA